MDCKCGGVVQTSKDEMDSIKAKKNFPNTFIPEGYSRILITHGMCKCTRYLTKLNLIERGKTTSTTTQLF